MRVNLHISAGAVLAMGLLVATAWYVYKSGGPPQSEVGVHTVPGGVWKAPEFIPTNGGMLTIAWVKGYETFEKRSPSETELKLPNGAILKLPLPFGETISEIRTSAKYQYQIRLEKRWPIKCSEQQCVVRTGPIELAEPVAIYHEETQRKTKSGWARFDKAENLEQLNQSLSRLLALTGNESRNRDVALRDGRSEVERFVREWMVRDGAGARHILVLYPGEQILAGKPVTTH